MLWLSILNVFQVSISILAKVKQKHKELKRMEKYQNIRQKLLQAHIGHAMTHSSFAKFPLLKLLQSVKSSGLLRVPVARPTARGRFYGP